MLFGRLRKRRAPDDPAAEQKRRRDAVVAAPDDDFVRGLLLTTPAGAGTADPTYLEGAGAPAQEEARPYLELTEEELAHHATRETIPRGPHLGEQAVDGAGEVVDRLVLEPMRIFIENFGFLAVSAAVLIVTCTTMGWLISMMLDQLRPLHGG